MRKTINLAVLAAVAASSTVPVAVSAQTRDERADRTYQGRDGRYYDERCKRSSGTTGAVAGGVGGAVVGNALGGGLLGTVVGAGGGALLGRHLDKKHDAAQNRKNGC